MHGGQRLSARPRADRCRCQRRHHRHNATALRTRRRLCIAAHLAHMERGARIPPRRQHGLRYDRRRCHLPFDADSVRFYSVETVCDFNTGQTHTETSCVESFPYTLHSDTAIIGNTVLRLAQRDEGVVMCADEWEVVLERGV